MFKKLENLVLIIRIITTIFHIVLFKVLKDTSLVKKQTVESYIYYIYIPIVPDMSVVT